MASAALTLLAAAGDGSNATPSPNNTGMMLTFSA
jgi:hypothetical protein